MKQSKVFPNNPDAYGGVLRSTRAGRQGARPLCARGSMHIVLRSTKAVGGKSFRVPRNAAKVTQILNKFTARNGIRMHSVANSGNHLHLHLKLGSRHSYKPFIRAVTSAIATAIHGRGKFWDHRPFSRVVRGLRAFLRVRDYLHINQMEMFGLNRQQAREIVRWRVSRGLLEAPG